MPQSFTITLQVRKLYKQTIHSLNCYFLYQIILKEWSTWNNSWQYNGNLLIHRWDNFMYLLISASALFPGLYWWSLLHLLLSLFLPIFSCLHDFFYIIAFDSVLFTTHHAYSDLIKNLCDQNCMWNGWPISIICSNSIQLSQSGHHGNSPCINTDAYIKCSFVVI